MPEIHEDQSVYPRVMVDQGKVEEYAAIMREDGSMNRFPPIKAGRQTGIIYDGWHRYRAAKMAEVPLNVEFVDDPPSELERAILGAKLNQHGKPLDSGDRREMIRRFWLNRGGCPYSLDEIARIVGTTVRWVKYYFNQFDEEVQREQHAKAMAAAPEEKPVELRRAEGMIEPGERLVPTPDGYAYMGKYAPDTPPDKVVYRKREDGAVIDYSSVKVEGQDVADLVIDLRRILRRVTWVKEAAIFHYITLEDVSLFNEASQILTRAAQSRKSGAAPVTEIQTLLDLF